MVEAKKKRQLPRGARLSSLVVNTTPIFWQVTHLRDTNNLKSPLSVILQGFQPNPFSTIQYHHDRHQQTSESPCQEDCDKTFALNAIYTFFDRHFHHCLFICPLCTFPRWSFTMGEEPFSSFTRQQRELIPSERIAISENRLASNKA